MRSLLGFQTFQDFLEQSFPQGPRDICLLLAGAGMKFQLQERGRESQKSLARGEGKWKNEDVWDGFSSSDWGVSNREGRIKTLSQTDVAGSDKSWDLKPAEPVWVNVSAQKKK